MQLPLLPGPRERKEKLFAPLPLPAPHTQATLTMMEQGTHHAINSPLKWEEAGWDEQGDGD